MAGGLNLGRALGATLAACAVVAPAASAETFKVNTGADLAPNGCTKNDCSVREAIIAANKNGGPDTVVLKSNRFHGLNIPGTDEDMSKTGDLDVLGKTTIKASKTMLATIHANGIDRVIHALAPLKIIRLEITGGETMQSSVAGLGLYAPADRVVVKRSEISGNTGAGNSTGGISAHGGGSLVKSEVSSNVGTNSGGASLSGDGDKPFKVKKSKFLENTGTGLVISNGEVVKSEISRNEAFQCGGVKLFSGVLEDSLVADNETVPAGMNTFGGGGVCLRTGGTIVGSTITGNTSVADGGGVEVFGGEEIINSTIHDNLASDEGGGVSVLFSDPFRIERSTFTENVAGTDGGGLRAGSARIIVKSSTFQGNEGVLGGGIVANDQPTGSNDSIVDLRWSTISQNNSGSGGGIGGEDGGSFLSEGTVIDGNMAVGAQKDCNATVLSGGHNFIGVTAGCNAFDQGGDISGFPALLGPIADNGGPTLTMKPTNSSSLIDEGGNGCPSLDQRGKPRPKDDACDIGSVER